MEGLQLAIKSAKLTETACREKNAPWPPARSGRQSRADSKSMTAGELQCRDSMKVRTEFRGEKSQVLKKQHMKITSQILQRRERQKGAPSKTGRPFSGHSGNPAVVFVWPDGKSDFCTVSQNRIKNLRFHKNGGFLVRV